MGEPNDVNQAINIVCLNLKPHIVHLFEMVKSVNAEPQCEEKKTCKTKPIPEDGGIFGKHALVRPTRESFMKALQEHAEFIRETRENDDPTIVNPLRFLQRAIWNEQSGSRPC
jgi:hypothetical protein